MGSARSTRWPLTAIALATLALTGLAVTGASGESVRTDNLVLTIGGNAFPNKLPARRFKPITLRANGHVRTVDGTHPPAARRVVVDFDSDGTVFTKGLPRCDPRRLEARSSRAALRACKSALVGVGRTRAEVQFPEQAPFLADGPLLIFNGPPRGRLPTVVMHVYANVPAPTAFVAIGLITNVKGRRFGKRLSVRVPVIAGGSGSLIDFNAKARRFFGFRGQRRSYLYARCPDGRFIARGLAVFTDGTRLVGHIVRRCRRL